MRRAALGLAALALAPPPAVATGPPAPPLVAGAPRVAESDGFRVVTVELEGRVIAYALPRRGNGHRVVALAVATAPTATPEPAAQPGERGPPPCPGERPAGPAGVVLLGLDPGTARLTRLREDLPAELRALDAADLDGDGIDELLLAVPGALLRSGWTGAVPDAVETVLSDPELAREGLHPLRVRSDVASAAEIVPVVSLRELRVYFPGANGRTWARRASLPLMVDGRFTPAGLLLTGTAPRLVDRRPDGTLVFATEAEAEGDRRLRTRIHELAASGPARSYESWSRLPGPERVLGRHLLRLDGSPVLLVTTMPADRLSLFGERRVRLFPLRRDRSRLGLAPSFAAVSRINVWQTETPSLVDGDGDGRHDLVLGYWKGLAGAKVVLDVYLARPGGGFDRRPRTTALDVADADTAFLHFGDDLTGDGLPDLVVRAGEALRIYPGRRGNRGAKLVATAPHDVPIGGPAERPDRTVTISTGAGVTVETGPEDESRPAFADLDGDGTREAIVVDPGPPGRVHVVSRAPR